MTKSDSTQRRLAIVKNNGNTQGTSIGIVFATTFLRRLIGLLGRRVMSNEEGLWLYPCASIHTFGMRFVIDVVFLDKNQRVVGFADAVPPNRIRVAPKGTVGVLELSEGNLRRTGINLDDLLNFD